MKKVTALIRGKEQRPEYVRWIDSHSFIRQVWRTLDDTSENWDLLPIDTVGYVINESKQSLQLGMSVSRPGGNITGDITIPKSAIVKRIKL